MYALTIATEGAVDREKAKAAASRIFTLIDRESEIDPLSEEGRKDALFLGQERKDSTKLLEDETQHSMMSAVSA